jgi:hypothetical protein
MATRPCECGQWADQDSNGTGCTESTKRTFRQGHDARWASWLVAMQREDRWVSRNGGAPVSPVEAAAMVGLRYDIAAKAARIANRKTRKTTKPAEPQPVTATIKLGRWSYDNASIAPSGHATYQTRGGDTKTAAPGSYVLVGAE